METVMRMLNISVF